MFILTKVNLLTGATSRSCIQCETEHKAVSIAKRIIVMQGSKPKYTKLNEIQSLCRGVSNIGYLITNVS